MNQQLVEELTKDIRGDVQTSEETLKEYSHDASLFEVTPQVVIFPKDKTDVENVIKFVIKHKKSHPELSITARSAGTDMGGGSINESIILAFGKYFNHTLTITGTSATTEPGVFYRDFEHETLKHNLIFPSYPASRSICAMGGIVNNNSGGEKSLAYGKTEQYVKKLTVVLQDGHTYSLEKLTQKDLNKKMKQKNFEGEVYTKMYQLISHNYDEIMKAKPSVHKNSAGYYLWNVYDKEQKTFDLTKLWVGAQGTLGILVEAEIALVPVHTHRQMMIIFLHDMKHLGEIIREVLPFHPESFESYDDNTLKLALRFFPEFVKQLGISGMIQAGFAFLPAFLMMATGRLPKLILQVDFTGDDPQELHKKIVELREKLLPIHPTISVAIENQENKYWLVRRESFNLLRKKIHDKHTAPFIDDFVIDPQKTADVIPQVTAIIQKHPEFIFTVAGHVGDGNYHIIPLVDINNPNVRKFIPEIAKEVYDIIINAGGSITGEHNDGLIRTPYLKQMYGENIIKLFEETKNIFDPQHIFNPRKKVFGSLEFAMNHLRENW